MRALLLVLAGIVLGAAALGAARLVALPPPPVVHHHANWALVLDGERVDLTSAEYMEDVAACRADAALVAPEERAHMHANDHDAVHVHANGVTWGHFLANIGYALNARHLVTDAGRVVADSAGHTLKFVVNREPVRALHNRLIRSEDRVLISYGPETVDEVVRTQFPRVASTAARLNALPDPATCSGPTAEPFGDRLRRAFWF